MTAVYIGLGSNLGDREGNLRAALACLSDRGVEAVRVSSFWLSAPVPADQPSFLNAAAEIDYRGSPFDLLEILKCIEYSQGRRPGRRWGPRPLDLDILLFRSERITTSLLTVPHPLMFERPFVLAPLLEVLERKTAIYRQVLARLQESRGAVRRTRVRFTLEGLRAEGDRRNARRPSGG